MINEKDITLYDIKNPEWIYDALPPIDDNYFEDEDLKTPHSKPVWVLWENESGYRWVFKAVYKKDEYNIGYWVYHRTDTSFSEDGVIAWTEIIDNKPHAIQKDK